MKSFVPVVAAFAAVVAISLPARALAHCDALDGPVVTAARKALDTGKPGPVLAWVTPAGEAEVKRAFEQTLAVRKLGPQAKELADRSFFETLVRVHRAGEGAPYTGLKPAGMDFGPAIPAAEKSLEQKSPKTAAKLVMSKIEEGLHARFDRLSKHAPPGDDVGAGREWVEAYVDYLHYVEGLYEAAAKGAGHGATASADEKPAHEHGHE